MNMTRVLTPTVITDNARCKAQKTIRIIGSIQPTDQSYETTQDGQDDENEAHGVRDKDGIEDADVVGDASRQGLRRARRPPIRHDAGSLGGGSGQAEHNSLSPVPLALSQPPFLVLLLHAAVALALSQPTRAHTGLRAPVRQHRTRARHNLTRSPPAIPIGLHRMKVMRVIHGMANEMIMKGDTRIKKNMKVDRIWVKGRD